jgi:hypothetical protein
MASEQSTELISAQEKVKLQADKEMHDALIKLVNHDRKIGHNNK